MNRTMIFIQCFSLLLFTGSVNAKTLSVGFSDPKGVNAISIVVDSTLEPIVGFASSVNGNLTVDTGNRKILSGKISIPTSGITLSNPTMTKVLHSETWLDAEKHPEIFFTYLNTISLGDMSDNVYTMTVEGELTIAGTTQKVKAPVSLTLLPGEVKNRIKGGKGDLIILRSTLTVSRKAFNLNPSTPVALVGEAITLTINLAGVQSDQK